MTGTEVSRKHIYFSFYQRNSDQTFGSGLIKYRRASGPIQHYPPYSSPGE